MAVFQIILICILGAGALVSLGFTIAFLVEAYSKPKEEVVQSNEKTEEVTEIDLDQMLAKLEQASKDEPKEEEKVEEAKSTKKSAATEKKTRENTASKKSGSRKSTARKSAVKTKAKEAE